jgi:DNA-binding NtrC family response regulator
VTVVGAINCPGDPDHGLVGAHPCMVALRDAIRRAARMDAPVVVWGPTGAGKELVARALHALSDARRRLFCPVNVAAVPEALVETELFGSVRGGFTGACDRRGLIEAAAGGTLFLDEAGDLPRAVQPKLLRALETGEVRRVGGTAVGEARFRLVVAVQDDPRTLMESGRWREDLYYRVTGIVLRVPPLAERRSDIPLLVAAFVEREHLPPPTAEAIDRLRAHDWPGNVRELQRVLVRAAFQSRNGVLEEADVVDAVRAQSGAAADARPLPLEAARIAHVRATVAAFAGNRRQAAHALGISPRHLYRLLARSQERDCRTDTDVTGA